MFRACRPVLESLENRFAPAQVTLVPLHLGALTARVATLPTSVPPSVAIDWNTPSTGKPTVITDSPLGSADTLMAKASVVIDTPIGSPDIFKSW